MIINLINIAFHIIKHITAFLQVQCINIDLNEYFMMMLLNLMAADHIGMSDKETLTGPYNSVSP